VLDFLGDPLDVLLILLDELVLHCEVMLRIDRSLFRHEIAHMPVGGQNVEVLAKVFFNGPRLRWRLDDDEIRGHD